MTELIDRYAVILTYQLAGPVEGLRWIKDDYVAGRIDLELFEQYIAEFLKIADRRA